MSFTLGGKQDGEERMSRSESFSLCGEQFSRRLFLRSQRLSERAALFLAGLAASVALNSARADALWQRVPAVTPPENIVIPFRSQVAERTENKEATSVAESNPVITSIEPTSGLPGTQVTITGSGFVNNSANEYVDFGDQAGGRVTSVTDSQVQAILPGEINPGSRPVSIKFFGSLNSSNEGPEFTVPAVAIFQMLPTSASPGMQIIISGQNFDSQRAGNIVRIGGFRCPVIDADEHQITALVPAAASSGSVSVTAYGQSVTYETNLTITNPISIVDISPHSGPLGSFVKISGTGFSANAEENTVSFDGVGAKIITASTNELDVIVPVNAHTGPILVSSNASQAHSDRSFIVSTPQSLLADGSSQLVAASAAGQQVSFTFDIAAGTSVGLGLSDIQDVATGADLYAGIAIYDPFNALLPGAQNCLGSCDFFLNDLSVSGTYTVRITAYGSGAQPSALATLSTVRDVSPQRGYLFAIQQFRPGEVSRMSFDAEAGQAAAVEVMAMGNLYDPNTINVRIVAPDDSVVMECSAPCSSPMVIPSLPRSGTYTVDVQQTTDRQNLVGTVEVKLAKTLAVDGDELYLSNDYGWQAGLVSFFAPAGTDIGVGVILPITISANGLTFTSQEQDATIYDDSGSIVASQPACIGLTGSVYRDSYVDQGCKLHFKSLASGIYTLITRQSKGTFSDGGVYRFYGDSLAKIFASKDFSDTLQVDGDERTMALRPGQTGSFFFEGGASDDVQLKWGTHLPNYKLYEDSTFNLIDPNSEIVQRISAGAYDGSIDLPALDDTGTFELRNEYSAIDSIFNLPVSLVTLQNCEMRSGPIGTTLEITGVEPTTAAIGNALMIAVSVVPSRTLCGQPTGSVDIELSNGVDSCTVDLAVSSSCTLTVTTGGDISVYGDYTPDDRTMFSASNDYLPDAIEVQKYPTTLAAHASPEPSVGGEIYTVVAEVHAADSSPSAPTGDVTVRDEFGNTCFFYLPDDSCQMHSLYGGTRTLKATYFGDDVNESASSQPFEHNIVGGLEIFRFSPPEGDFGDVIDIVGNGFGETPDDVIVSFNGQYAQILEITDTEILASVPYGATTGYLAVYVGSSVVVAYDTFYVVPDVPLIDSFTPNFGPFGSVVTITGRRFSSVIGDESLYFGDGYSTILSSSETEIVAEVPANASTGIISLYVDGNYAQSSQEFTVTSSLSPPIIDDFSPKMGPIGTSVSISGSNFSTNPTANVVSVNGVSASVTASSETELGIEIPEGASTGKITVSVGGNSTVSTDDFVVVGAQPVITDFTPQSGPPGTSVLISGANFSIEPAADIVTVNGVPAVVVSASPNALSIAIPGAASSGPIGVTVGGQSAFSASTFTVTATEPALSVDGFHPSGGVVGTVVTITGTGFDAGNPQNNAVRFNGTVASVIGGSSAELVAVVPSGASTGPISVASGDLTATSDASFEIVAVGSVIPTVTIASVDAEPSKEGDPFTIEVLVAPPASDGQPPTGQVTVVDGKQACIIELPATACTLTEPIPGEVKLYGTYSGDATYAGATSAAWPHITNPSSPTEVCGFDPSTVPNDPDGFVPVDQLSGVVYTRGFYDDIIGSAPLSVQITSPVANTTTAESSVDVVGTFSGPVNAGIAVNGILGYAVDGHFIVSNVPLTSGVNTLTVAATTLPGDTASSTTTVNRSGMPNPVSMMVNTASGFAPSAVDFSLSIGMLPDDASVQTAQIDSNGDGVYDATADSMAGLPTRFIYNAPGLYTAALHVVDSNGGDYVARRSVLVRDMSAERGMLCDVYGYLKDRLNQQDAAGASSAYQTVARPSYLAMFNALGDKMPTLAGQLGVIANGFVGQGFAELTLVRDNADQTRSGYPLRLTRGSDGVWRISEM